MRIRHHTKVVGLLGTWVLSGAASACVMEDPVTPPPPTWWIDKGPSPTPGFTRQALYMNVGLFPPTTATTCACGFGYVGPASLTSLLPIDAGVVILDQTTCDVIGTVPQFDPLTPNPITTADLNNPSLYPAGAGSQWFGFSGLIATFTPPTLPPNAVFAICFTIDVPDAIDALFKQGIGCVTGGVGDQDGHPIFQGEHAVGDPFGCRPIPTPGAFALLALGGVIAARRRR